ncbi:MAG: hypothetical protein QW481_01460 [Candidatus Methanomethylicia archaeon]
MSSRKNMKIEGDINKFFTKIKEITHEIIIEIIHANTIIFM